MGDPANPNSDAFSCLKPDMSPRQLRSSLDRVQMSADAKAILNDLISFTVTVGSRILQIGRKIVEVALAMVKAFPNLFFGAVVAVVISMLIAQVAVIGAALGAILGPLLIAFGIGQGLLVEMRSGDVGDRVRGFVDTVSAAFSADLA